MEIRTKTVSIRKLMVRWKTRTPNQWITSPLLFQLSQSNQFLGRCYFPSSSPFWQRPKILSQSNHSGTCPFKGYVLAYCARYICHSNIPHKLQCSPKQNLHLRKAVCMRRIGLFSKKYKENSKGFH